MTYKSAALLLLGTGIPLLMTLTGCSKAHANDEPPVTPPAKVVPFGDVGLFTVEHPEQFPLATASEHPTTSELIVTGAVTPDVSRNIPVVSLASGRVVGIHARLGDTVVKGQLMLSVRSDDVSGGFSNYGSVLI
jgi:cobalt-zinc-cadmium efflux system membrane fusion protein